MVDHYDLRYLDELIQRQLRQIPQTHDHSSRQNIFMNYARCLMLFTEGKHFSNRVEVAMMARKLAAFEHDMAYRGQNEVSHMELHDIWAMVENLDGAISLSQRPSQVQILTSLADQRKPVHGVVCKDSLDCRIAAVSCQNLEKLYLG